MTTALNHEEYIAAAPEQLRPLLKELRGVLSSALSDANEVIKYKMPGFQIGEVIVAGYAAFSKQCGLYVAPAAIRLFEEEISKAGLKATKTGVTFSPSNPIPNDLVTKLAKASRKEHGI